ncbi:hypothetical protein ACFLT9_03900 [Acidobacteriota bacterium]
MKNILFDIGHPAHVHLFRLLIIELKSRGHRVTVTSRSKDVTHSLLDHYGIEHLSLSRVPRRPALMIGELLKRDLGVFKLHRKHKFQIALGTSVSIAHLSALTRVKSFIFEEDDDAVVPTFAAITYPFSTGIVVPDCLKFTKWENKRIVHNSYHELAYLHPDLFTPDYAVLAKYHLEPERYVLIRGSALRAHHDVNIRGLREDVLDRLSVLFKDYKILSSHEEGDSSAIDPWDMHHVLSFSKMLVTDSQTMTAEAACLGVPSIRYNSFVGKISYLEELEHKYELTFGFSPGQEEQMYSKIENLLGLEDLSGEWTGRKTQMLARKQNFLEWMLRFLEPLL